MQSLFFPRQTSFLQGEQKSQITRSHQTHALAGNRVIFSAEVVRYHVRILWAQTEELKKCGCKLFQLLVQYGVGLGLHRQAWVVLFGPTNYEECLHWSEWVSEWHICISESPQQTRFNVSCLYEFKNWEFQFLLRQHQRQNCCHGNSSEGVILFLLWCTFVVRSSKNTASIVL